jgi:hypothetical protein
MFPSLIRTPNRACFVQILAIKAVRDACIDGDLSTAEQLLTQDISIDANYTSYAYRSFVMSRKYKWSHALQDAIKVTLTN